MVPGFLEFGQARVYALQKNIVEAKQMDFVIEVNNLLIFHVVEQPIEQNGALLEHVPPEPLNALVVGALARYEATSTYSSVWVFKHESGHANILPTSIAPHSTRQTVFSDATDEQL